jgi:hypothetical protein
LVANSATPRKTNFGVFGVKSAISLFEDGRVGRQQEEVIDAARLMQIADEGAHESGLVHAGPERETQRGEVPLEVRDRKELAAELMSSMEATSSALPLGVISMIRCRISSDRRCGGRRLRRPATAFT